MGINKKLFNELLTKEDATIKINDMFYLHRWTTTALGQKVDYLQLICNNPIGAYSDYDYYIIARDFSEFLEEFSHKIKKYFYRLAEEEAKKAKNNAFNFGNILVHDADWFILL